MIEKNVTNSRRTIKINFSDFWEGFTPENNFLYDTLSKHFNIQLSDDPEFLIYSNFGNEFIQYNCTKVFYTGENVRPNFWETDFSISFDYESHKGKNLRYPLYNLYGDINSLLDRKNPQLILSQKTKFCNMVVSNPKGRERFEFFKLLNKYKHLDSGGKISNNIGGPIANKRDFIRNYKFTMAFENSSYPGYTTEKIIEPMYENSIPIYWGNPNIDSEFNTESFVNVHNFSSLKEAAEYVAYLDQNDNDYMKILKEPWLKNNELNQYMNEFNLVKFFDHVFSSRHNKTSGKTKNLIATNNYFWFRLKYFFTRKNKWNA